MMNCAVKLQPTRETMTGRTIKYIEQIISVSQGGGMGKEYLAIFICFTVCVGITLPQNLLETWFHVGVSIPQP